jgi:hypothetical protein
VAYTEARIYVSDSSSALCKDAVLARVFGAVASVLRAKGVGVQLRAAAVSCLPSLLTCTSTISDSDMQGVTLWHVLGELEVSLGPTHALPVRLASVTAVWSACAHGLENHDKQADNELLVRVVGHIRGCLRHANADLRCAALRCLHSIACRCSK